MTRWFLLLGIPKPTLKLQISTWVGFARLERFGGLHAVSYYEMEPLLTSNIKKPLSDLAFYTMLQQVPVISPRHLASRLNVVIRVLVPKEAGGLLPISWS